MTYKKVVLFGASGNLGKAFIEALLAQNYELSLVLRDAGKISLRPNDRLKVHEISTFSPTTLHKVLENQDIVISTLGKSVSVFKPSRQSYWDVDYSINLLILGEALKQGIKKFVYVSVFHSEKYSDLDYFRAHHAFAEALKSTHIDYLIIKPLALFCAFLEMIPFAQKGQLALVGKGDKLTNPIHEADVAAITLENLEQKNLTIELGGPKIYTRKQLFEIIQGSVNQKKKVRQVPLFLLPILLWFLKISLKNSYDTMAFYAAVLQHDTIAPKMGTADFENYITQNFQKTAKFLYPCGLYFSYFSFQKLEIIVIFFQK